MVLWPHDSLAQVGLWTMRIVQVCIFCFGFGFKCHKKMNNQISLGPSRICIELQLNVVVVVGERVTIRLGTSDYCTWLSQLPQSETQLGQKHKASCSECAKRELCVVDLCVVTRRCPLKILL